MTAQNDVAIAELKAAIAVVISLVYLAIQVRQSNRVNSAANDDPACVEPLVRQSGGFSEQLFD